jgi:two-component system CheB/CheR fusion protein
MLGRPSDLNAFMESILGSLEAAVIVLDRDLVVQVWTPRAHELWGLRADETVGQDLLNLDSGLPTAELHPWLRSVITGQQTAIIRQMDAVDRRGRTVRLRVTVSALQTDSDEPAGALILMEDVSEIGSADDAEG